ncbi:MAG TPA: xanthine dehydrogenase family protein subunit M [Chloroflexi bacterium]|nr:xanthine dehydrogenase family protein subunit M [Chloroflexota bacterium]
MTDYRFPVSVEEALDILDAHAASSTPSGSGSARVIAGGTDLILDMRRGKRNPACLVDLTRIPGLDQIRVIGGVVEVGAAVTFAAIQEHPYLRQHVPALTAAARSVGALGIQTAATWVGNIVQAMPAADGAVVALALEAEARVVDRDGAVWWSVEELFLGPGRSVVDSTRQIVTHVRFPLPGHSWGTSWQRVGRRASLVLPIINCAVRIVLDGEGIEQAVIALGPVAPRPFRARQAESVLTGQRPTDEALAEAARIAQGESDPRSSVKRASREYRLAILPALVRAALHEAVRRARGSER